MSLKLAAAKLSATAAGVALMTGGAVQVAQPGGAVRTAEPLVTVDPIYSSDADGKLVKGAAPLPVPVSPPSAAADAAAQLRVLDSRSLARALAQRRRRLLH